ncbi:MAG: TRAP transporter TatT component family protein [Roseateles sp.]
MKLLPLRLLVLLLAASLLSACSPRLMLVRSVADELASQGQAEEEDLLLAREASAFYLKLSESLLRQTPGHLALAESVAGGFTQYAYAFVAFEADRLESRDARAAQALRQRAARLYLRAHRHAMAALEQHHGGAFLQRLQQSSAAQPLPPLPAEQVGVAYWAAASWAAYISLSKDKPEAVADLPLVLRLAEWAWATQPAHGEGALAGLLATLEASRPGGKAQRAETLFDQAIAAADGRNAGALVGKAETLALPAGDRAAFEALLRQALAVPGQSLGTQVMRQRAQWLLDSADDLF